MFPVQVGFGGVQSGFRTVELLLRDILRACKDAGTSMGHLRFPQGSLGSLNASFRFGNLLRPTACHQPGQHFLLNGNLSRRLRDSRLIADGIKFRQEFPRLHTLPLFDQEALDSPGIMKSQLNLPDIDIAKEVQYLAGRFPLLQMAVPQSGGNAKHCQ